MQSKVCSALRVTDGYRRSHAQMLRVHTCGRLSMATSESSRMCRAATLACNSAGSRPELAPDSRLRTWAKLALSSSARACASRCLRLARRAWLGLGFGVG